MPLKIFKSVRLITLLAALIGLGLILNLFSIPLPAFGIDLSFAWLPTMVIGWAFGPVVGCLLGIIVDNLNFLIHGGVWFYLYAIQQPLLALMAGMIGSSFRLAIKYHWHYFVNVILNQIFLIVFICFSAVMMFIYTNPDSSAFKHLVQIKRMSYQVNNLFRYLILSFLILFLVIIETFSIIKYKQHVRLEKNIYKFNLFLYSSIVCILSTFIFSFILGPISAIKYLEYLLGRTPSALFKYGIAYYLLPRILKECVKTPVYIFLFFSVLAICIPIFENIKKMSLLTYKLDTKKSRYFHRINKFSLKLINSVKNQIIKDLKPS